MKNKDIDYVWHEQKLYEPENAEHIEKFLQEFSGVDFYIEAVNRAGFRYIHKIGDDEKKIHIDKDMVMVENKDAIVFYSDTTREQSPIWIMKQRPGSFLINRSFYPSICLEEKSDVKSAIDSAIKKMSEDKRKMGKIQELMEYEGTEEEPFIVDEPFDILRLENKTPFGVRYGFGEVIPLKAEHFDAMIEGKYIAIDVEREYVAFLKLDQTQQPLQSEIVRLREELKIANQFKELYLSKWEKWEDRARALYRGLYGKDPQ